MRRCASLLMVALWAGPAGCAHEATAPQGGAGVARVVPVAVPDVWCPAASDPGQETTAAPGQGPSRTVCEAVERSAPGSPSRTVLVDSTSAPSDTTK
jgi:hypothetical protein